MQSNGANVEGLRPEAHYQRTLRFSSRPFRFATLREQLKLFGAELEAWYRMVVSCIIFEIFLARGCCCYVTPYFPVRWLARTDYNWSRR